MVRLLIVASCLLYWPVNPSTHQSNVVTRECKQRGIIERDQRDTGCIARNGQRIGGIIGGIHIQAQSAAAGIVARNRYPIGCYAMLQGDIAAIGHVAGQRETITAFALTTANAHGLGQGGFVDIKAAFLIASQVIKP